MTDPDVVFAAFVNANPVPDGGLVDEPPADVHEILGILPARTDGPSTAVSTLHRGVWAAAAAVVMILAVGVLLVAVQDDPVSHIATEPSPGYTPEQRAVGAVEEWLAALNDGDIEAVMALSSPATRSEANRRVHEWQTGLAESGTPVDVQRCDVAFLLGSTVRVECAVRLNDVVAIELGVADLVAPFDYDEGLVTWQPYVGGDIGKVNEAYASYLQTFHPAEYEAGCSPTGYPPGAVIQDRGLALTGECARLVAPLAPEVAQWIRDGKPGGP